MRASAERRSPVKGIGYPLIHIAQTYIFSNQGSFSALLVAKILKGYDLWC